MLFIYTNLGESHYIVTAENYRKTVLLECINEWIKTCDCMAFRKPTT